METIYSFQSIQTKSEALFSYQNGGLVKVDLSHNEDMSIEKLTWLYTCIASMSLSVENNLLEFAKVGLIGELPVKDLFVLTKIETVPNFDLFWNTYAKKQKRIRAEKLFNKLNDAQKIQCVAAAKTYNDYLKRTGKGMYKQLPDTFISSGDYLTDWKKEY